MSNSHRLSVGARRKIAVTKRQTAGVFGPSKPKTAGMSILIGAILLLTVPATPAQQRLASSVVHRYGDEDSESRAVFTAPVSLPPNVAMPAAYDDLIDAMLRSSPTFRGQCTRIGRAGYLRIVVQRSLSAPPQSAVTRVVRQSDGRLEAHVEVGLFGDVVTLIAHEFEHVIEQLDGVNLAAMAGRSGTGVHTDPGSGQFETERAIAIGQRVAHEVSNAVARR